MNLPEIRETKLMLIHGAYPYLEELGMILNHYENVYADISSFCPYASIAAEDKLLKLFELAPLNKVCFGTDGAKPEDALLAVGFKPYTNYTVEILKHFRKVGAKTVAISDKPSSPLAINADISLLPGNRTPSYGFVMAVTIIKALGISVSRIHDPEVLEYYEKKKDFLLENDILM